MTRIIHNRVRCQSIGVCEAMAPENFQFNDANEMTVVGDGTVSDEQLDQVREAVAGCPNEALTLLDEGDAAAS
jgi:ferredoxin